MRIVNVTKTDLEKAMAEVNKLYDGNIMFKSMKSANAKSTTWNVSLRAVKSDGPGARTSFSGRKSIAACWHVHGDFMDALPKEAKIYSGMYGKTARHPGEPWEDCYTGSTFNRVHLADLCEC